ncbi:MAG: NADH-quinone oxidoreductase subunit N [Thermoplasmatota archaeon]
MTLDNDAIVVLLPEIVLVIAGIFLPLLGAFLAPPSSKTGRAAARNAGERRLLAALALVALALAGLLATANLYEVPGLGFAHDAYGRLLSATEQATAPGSLVTGATAFNLLEVSPFVYLFQLVFLAVAGVVVLASPSYYKAKHQGEYYALILLSLVGMMVVASARDLVMLFVGIELASFCTYALAGFFKNAPDSSEAAVKYFIVGSLSSALTLFGISLFYGLAGSTQFADINRYTGQVMQQLASRPTDPFPALLVFAWGFLLAGFGFKIALVPFHNWAPDVYDGSPTTISAFLSAGSKKMGFAALFKVFLFGLIAVKANWMWAAGLVAIVTMTVGNVVALSQKSIKRMLAYSSIAQAGYMLIALPIATQYALAGGLFHIVTHAFMKSGAFLVVAAVAAVGVGETLDDWKGLGKRTPFLAFAMAVFMISFAGLPPLAGFASKFVLFSAAVQAGGWFVWLAVFGILNSVVSLFFYARLIRVMYVEDGPSTEPLRVGLGASVAVGIALVAVIGIGLYPAPVFDLATKAASVLLP